MKRTLISAFIIAVMATFAAASTHAQGNRNPEDWKKKMMSEKVAFFTVELDLTPEEAQKFWPVYNQVDKEKDEATAAVFKAYFELGKALEAKKPEKEISNLLDQYVEAMEKQSEINVKADEKFRKVLPVEKVARLYIGEETFRRQYIRRLHGGPGDRKGN